MQLRRIAHYIALCKRGGLRWTVGAGYHALQRGWRRSRGLRDFPDRLQVELSSVCNMDCEYCGLRRGMSNTVLMSPEVFERLVPYFKLLRSVTLSGLAEPFINRHFVDFIRRIKRESKGCYAETFTNALLMDEDACAALVDSGLDSLVFSLDGTDSGLVDAIRKGGDVDKTVRNVRLLQETKRAAGSRTPFVSATTVLQRKNYRQLPRVLEAVADLGITRMNVNGMDPYSEDLVEHTLWHGRDLPGDLDEVVEETIRLAEERGVDLTLAFLRPQPAFCAEVGTPIVMANGDVVPCGTLAYSRTSFVAVAEDLETRHELRVTPTRVFGNILESGLDEIWRSEPFARFRAGVTSGAFPSACRECNIKHCCVCPQEKVAPRVVLQDLQRGLLPS